MQRKEKKDGEKKQGTLDWLKEICDCDCSLRDWCQALFKKKEKIEELKEEQENDANSRGGQTHILDTGIAYANFNVLEDENKRRTSDDRRCRSGDSILEEVRND